MKTKTKIPWALILKEINSKFATAQNYYICNLSQTFESLWGKDDTKAEIKRLMNRFLEKTKRYKKDVYVVSRPYDSCLLYGNIPMIQVFAIKKLFIEYMVEKTKPKTKYSYFQHPKLFGVEGLPFLARRDNKTGEFHYVYHNYKSIVSISSQEVCAQNVEDGIWIPANQKEINKIKHLYREPKYLYYRHSVKHCFGNPGSRYKHLMRYEPKTNDWFTYSYSDGITTERNNHYLWEACVKEGTWIPARKEEIKLAIKFNK